MFTLSHINNYIHKEIIEDIKNTDDKLCLLQIDITDDVPCADILDDSTISNNILLSLFQKLIYDQLKEFSQNTYCHIYHHVTYDSELVYGADGVTVMLVISNNIKNFISTAILNFDKIKFDNIDDITSYSIKYNSEITCETSPSKLPIKKVDHFYDLLDYYGFVKVDSYYSKKNIIVDIREESFKQYVCVIKNNIIVYITSLFELYYVIYSLI